MKNIRAEKINSEIQRCLYEIISQKVRNPKLTELVTIVRVDTANDLKHAKVYLSIFSKDGEKAKQTYDAITESASFIRHELARMVTFRTVPELHFFNDDSMEYSMKISKLIDETVAKDKGNQ